MIIRTVSDIGNLMMGIRLGRRSRRLLRRWPQPRQSRLES